MAPREDQDMSWFSPKPITPDPQIEEMSKKIEDLTREIAALRGERDGLKGARALEAERQALVEQIEKLKVEKGRADEENARKVRYGSSGQPPGAAMPESQRVNLLVTLSFTETVQTDDPYTALTGFTERIMEQLPPDLRSSISRVNTST